MNSTDREIQRLEDENDCMKSALLLIATGVRPDGTYNRDREACRLLAKKTLEELHSDFEEQE